MTNEAAESQEVPFAFRRSSWESAFRSWGLQRDSEDPQAVYEAGKRELYRTKFMTHAYYESGRRALAEWLGISI